MADGAEHGEVTESAIELIATSHGGPALQALHRWLSTVKADDVLAPATILVPNNMVGLSVRRALAGGDLGPISGGRAGLAGVDFLTPFRLAELFGATAMAADGRRPVSTAVIAAAVRRALAQGAPYFAAVAEHPTTERRLVAAHRELSDLDDEALDALARESARAEAVVDIHRRVRRVLAADFHQEQDLVAAAIDAIDVDPAAAAARLGPVALFLPDRLGGPRAAMVRSIAAATPLTVIVALSGSADADATPAGVLASLALATPATPPKPGPDPRLEVISVSDADDEVRHVVRGILGAADAGVPFDKMAVLYASANPYLRLLDDHLGAAGIPHNGAAVATLAESATGRVLRRLLALPDRDYRREDVTGLVGSTPLQWHGRPAPARAWDQLSRDAGVVRTLGSWERRLAIHRADLEDDLAGAAGDPDLDWRVRRLERSIALLDQLADFVAELATALERLMGATTWKARTRACRRLLTDYMGSRDTWPERERLAAERMDLVLDRLAGLDLVEPEASFAVFRRTLELELESGLGRSGAFGNGVLVGGASMAAALDLDRVWVVGMCEGSFPSRVRDDSLLPDRERRVTPGLALRSERAGDERRHLASAVAAVGANGVATLTAPRGDLRQSNERAASRWLVEAVQDRLGHPVSATSFDQAQASWIDHVPSFAAGVVTTPLPSTRQELELQTLVADAADGSLGDHPLIQASSVLRRGAESQRARDSGAFTRFDGNLAGLGIQAPGLDGRSVSATALETWARCPHQFFMRFLLGLDPLDTPEQRLQIDALTRGNLLHEIMERFVRTRIDGDGRLDTAAEERARLDEIAGAVFQAAAARGQTGEALYWRREQVVIRRLLAHWLMQDRARIRAGMRPRAVELTFGLRGDRPVQVDLGGGRTVALRGAIDRVDVGPDDNLVILDYKTGRTLAKVSADNPHEQGTRLQLVLYALAAADRLGLAVDDAYSGYWYLQAPADKAIRGYETSATVVSTVLGAVETILSGVAAGAFPQHPDPTTRGGGFVSCHYCDPDGLGVADAERRFLRKATDPALSDFVGLARPQLLAPARLGFDKGGADE